MKSTGLGKKRRVLADPEIAILGRTFFGVCFLISTIFTAGAWALSEECPVSITSGLVDYQVLQRDSADRGAVTIQGSLESHDSGRALARLLRRSRVVEDFEWQTVGEVRSGNWEAVLDGIPTGGPYDLEIQLLNSEGKSLGCASVHQVLVGDLWVMAGQSNMHGRGLVQGADPPNELVHSFDLSDHWQVAEEPVGISFEPTDLAHASFDRQGKRIERTPEEIAELRRSLTTGTGPGLAFARRMVERTGVPVALIPCARGGTSLEKWSPVRKAERGGSLYGAMLRRIQAVGGRVTGILWYQGESDAIEEGLAPLYAERFRNLVVSVRADLRQARLPFYYVQIGPFIGREDDGINRVRIAQWKVESNLENVGMATAVDLEVRDPVHISLPSLKRIAGRLANLACSDLFPTAGACAGLRKGPRPVSASLNAAERKLRVRFEGVNGRLVAPGRPWGFTIRDSDQTDLTAVYRVVLDSANPHVAVITVARELPEDAFLWYGWGNNPYCNIVDEKDMALPAFGPFQINRE
jgi:sialate O-acetylesterase